MKHLIALMLTLGTVTLIACGSKEEAKTQAVQEAHAVSLAISGMT